MDQLVVLQEIYSSFSKGEGCLQGISRGEVEGSCPDLVGRLLDSARKGRIDEEVCGQLIDRLQDVYEIKRLGDICRRAGLFGLAVRSYTKALSMSRDPVLRPVILNNLGQSYAGQGDLPRATVYYKKAAEGFEAAGDSSGLAHVLGNLGSAYRIARDWDRAIEHCYRGLKLFESRGDGPGIAQMNGGLGRIYAEMGERELAARYFESSLKGFQRLGDRRSAAWIMDRLGRIAEDGRDWDRAVSYYNQSLSIFDELGASQGSGVVLSDLGRTYLKMGEPGASRDALERAVRLVPRAARPAHHNALLILAAAYRYLAKESMLRTEGAEADISPRNTASEYYARASDRYLELLSLLEGDDPEIRLWAGLSRGLSYIARLKGRVPDDEAVALSERAIAALDAAGSPEGRARYSIDRLKRSISGMKEIWSAGLLGGDQGRQKEGLARAAEYLMGAANGSDEAESPLRDALQRIRGRIEEDAPVELESIASDLRRAEKRLLSRDVRSASRVGEAATIIGAGEAGSFIVQTRDVLLNLGWVLAERALMELDDPCSLLALKGSMKIVKEGEKSNEAPPDQRASDGREEIGIHNGNADPGPQEGLVPVSASLACKADGRIMTAPQAVGPSAGEEPERPSIESGPATSQDEEESPEAGADAGSLSRSGAIMLLKGLALTVVMLLSIEAVIHLI